MDIVRSQFTVHVMHENIFAWFDIKYDLLSTAKSFDIFTCKILLPHCRTVLRLSPPPEYNPTDDVLDTVNTNKMVVKHMMDIEPDEILYWPVTSALEIFHGEFIVRLCVCKIF